jgi:glycosyltransferase involved in cell wall biosynthesis
MTIVYFSTLAWDEAGGAHNPTQMARALARRGHPVIFVEPQPSPARGVHGLPIEVVALTELGMSRVQLRRAWFGLDSGDLSGAAAALLARLDRQQGRGPDMAIYSAPFDPFVRLVPALRAHGVGIAYYAMDDFADAPARGYTQFVPAAEDYLVREADALAAVSSHTSESLARRGRQAQVIHNGVDLGLFRNQTRTARAARLTRGELTLGFWGTLMESLFDAELVAQIAQLRPNWMIHLFGAVDPEPHRPSVRAQLGGYKNVVLHGAVPHRELPWYAREFDVALAPFPDSNLTRGRDPLKVYEYLAAHLPVVAAHAPQLADLPYVRVANTPTDFCIAVEAAARTPVDGKALDRFLDLQTWDTRGEALEQVLRAMPKRVPGAPGAPLSGFATPDAAAVMRYALALERELEDLQVWARELEIAAQAPGGFGRVKRLLPSRRKTTAE